MISADVKANRKNNKKNLVAVSYKFLKEIPPKLEIQCQKTTCIFLLIMVVILPILILPLRMGGVAVL